MKKIFLLLSVIIGLNKVQAQNWQQFSDSTMYIYNFYLDSVSNTLYATGAFVIPNGDTVVSPAYWNGIKWNTIGNFDFRNAGGYPYKVFKYDSLLYVGGRFKKSAGAPGDYVLKLNNISNTWDTLNFSPNGNVLCFNSYHASLYLGGEFNLCGPLLSSGVVMHVPPIYWWSIPPLLSIGRIETMKEYNGLIVFGGTFNADITLNYKGCVIGWNGFNYIPLADGLELNEVPYPIVVDMEIYNNKLYAGGIFGATNVLGGSRIVSWDGNTWSGVGGGINFDVYSLQVYDGDLYASGAFTYAGGIPADHIAKWDGYKWCSLGSNFNGGISDMCVYNNELIIAGGFTQIDGQPVNHIAKWVGGNYTDSCQVVGVEKLDLQNHFIIYPSPAKTFLNIKSDKIIIDNIRILEITGKNIVLTEVKKCNFQINISFLPCGFYFLILETKQGNVVKKFVKE